MTKAICSERDCDQPLVARGLCRSHYGKAKYRGTLSKHAAPRLEFDARARFEAFIGSRDNCWLWTGGKYPSGYGQFWLDGRNHTAHRASWLLYRGDIPDGLVVCHTCDVKACVCPDHLFLGSQADNIDDKTAKGRQAKGDGHGRAVLGEKRAQMVRDLYAAGHRQFEIAKLVGTDRQTVWRVVHGKSY